MDYRSRAHGLFGRHCPLFAPALIVLIVMLTFAANAASAPSSAPASAEIARPVLVLGDSLSAAHNIDKNAGWVALLASRLGDAKPPRAVINASISGETSAGGLARLPALLGADPPALVVLELGANDGLRGLPLAALRKNLDAMIRASQASGARVLLLGMDLPVNYGPVYREAFRRVYLDLSEKYVIPLVPFFLSAVLTDPRLMQEDGLHPTAAGQPKLLDAVWPQIEQSLAADRKVARY